MIRDQAESRHADAGACRPAASTRGATRPITPEPERHCKRQCGAHPCRPQKQATKKRPQCEQCADRTHGVRGHDAPDEVADEVVDPRHAFASRSRSQIDPFAISRSPGTRKRGSKTGKGKQRHYSVAAGTPCGPQPSHCSHPGARRLRGVRAARPGTGPYSRVIQRPQHATAHRTAREHQLYTRNYTHAYHPYRMQNMAHAFYRGSTGVLPLRLACGSLAHHARAGGS